ncbi:hypothetical protein [Bradyrhizobium sp. JYMT SZCCT0180]|uniref:hypothetical protein n=1 Tax=Bradyrhizobium sp. JYMT SZCCT0180 TaxID=2807666 RepID=UPI001BAC2435|nr:hypothetical protein [Bradyrhizobium sp. JYMT SZCCT0180]MBR1214655.1 hypothetical protein [Bradyrhizobium sp. JYMT SZCCT0180]
MTKARFEKGALYGLLPAVVRHRDSQIDGKPLEKVLKQFGQQADLLEKKIEEANANFFVETCDPQALPYIADLIGYRPILPLQPKEDASQPKIVPPPDPPPKLSLRRDVAKTIWARRRKGTPEVLGSIVSFITGWHTAVFENNREVVTTPSVRSDGAPRSQGTPDLRKLVGRNHRDQGPGLIPRVATLRRVDANGARGRWHPLDVVVEARSQRARLNENWRLHAIAGKSYLAVRENGHKQKLYAPANEFADATRILESARAVYLSDFVGSDKACFEEKKIALKERLYGTDRAICLYQSAPVGSPAAVPGTPVAIDAALVTFGNVADTTIAGGWVIDPERGWIQPPHGNRDPVFLRCYVACNSSASAEIEGAVRTRLNEHVPMEARTGVVHRS